jgi:putative membrane protein
MVIAWLAGLFYLPRLFVYHVKGLSAGEQVIHFEAMELNLSRFMTIIGSLAILSGIWLWLSYDVAGQWLYAKMGFVLALVIYQAACWRILQSLKRKRNIRRPLFYRLFNESTLFLAAAIILLVELKPF